MKKTALLIFVVFAFMACSGPQSETTPAEIEDETATEEILQAGDDKDEWGCIASAGETWSVLKQSCIQVFEVGEQLDPVEAGDEEAVVSAFVVSSDDGTQVELFLPDGDGVFILDETDEGVYENDMYKFESESGALYIDGEKKYEAS